MKAAALAALALAACHAPSGSASGPASGSATVAIVDQTPQVDERVPALPAPAGALSARDFGARGDGVSDDREPLQRAIDAVAARGGGDLYVPPGVYRVSQSARGHFGLDVPAGVRIHGAGPARTVLRQMAHLMPSSRLLHLSGADVVLEELTLDGDKAEQTRNEQRHGIFATDTVRLVVRHVTARNFTGDGFYLFNGAQSSHVTGVTATGNDRNGITLGGRVDDTTIEDSRFVGNRAQQVDSEPGGLAVVSNTTVTHCLIDGAGISNDYALTVSGTDKAKGEHWTVTDNTINGGVFVVWAEHVLIADNHGIDGTTKPAVTVYRSSSDVTVRGNTFTLTQSRVRGNAGILVQGTGPRQAPAEVTIADNKVTVTYEQSYGVLAEGAIDVEITGNTLHGAGRSAAVFSGVAIRATNEQRDFERAVVRGNTIRDFGERGVSVHGNRNARLNAIEISDNTFENDGDAAPMKTAISLDDGTGAAVQVTVHANHYGRGVRAPVINVPQRATLVMDPPAAPPDRSN